MTDHIILAINILTVLTAAISIYLSVGIIRDVQKDKQRNHPPKDQP